MYHAGRTCKTEHQIKTGSARPTRQSSYHIPYVHWTAIRKELEEMEARHDWASLIAVVPKKDGAIRLCVDFRRLNRVIQEEAYPMPRIDELLDQIGKTISHNTGLNTGILASPSGQGGQTKDSLHYTIRALPVHSHAIWTEWSSSHIPTLDGQVAVRTA